MRALGLIVIALAGCAASDPCDGLAGTCISARVEGPLTGLDGLRVLLGTSQTPQMMTSSPGGRFDLPARLAILLPDTVTSPATVGIEALAGGQVTGASGPVSVTFAPGGRTARTFVLQAGGAGDGGGNDLMDMGGSDGPPPGVVSFFPTSVDFATVARGQHSATKKVTLFNNTTAQVMTSATIQPTGDSNNFNLDTSQTTCFAADAGMNPVVTVPAGGSCTIAFIFAPDQARSFKMDLSAQFSDGETAGFSLIGTGTPVWAAENATMSTNFTGVWASGHSDWYAVANDSAGGLLHSDGQGNWTHLSNGTTPSGNCFSVYGLDANRVYLGCDLGRIYFGALNNVTVVGSPNSTSLVRGLYANATLGVFAAPDTPIELWKTNISNDFTNSFGPTSGTTQLRGLCGATTRAVAVGAGGQWYVKDTNDALWSFENGTGGATNFTPNLNGCWMPDDNTVWVVGDAPGGGGPGIIFHCTGNPFGNCSVETAPVNNSLTAISGRRDPMNSKFDIYAVGGLGNVVLHSDGGGTWTTVQVPNNQAMTGVFVLPSGEVTAVGFGGQINHLY